MRRFLLVCCLLPAAAAADSLWLEGAGSNGAANGSRVGISRTLENVGLTGASAGFVHNRVGDSWWSLVEAGLSRRIGADWIVQGKAQIGPGQLDGENFTYRKLNASATWLISREWSLELSDAYVNVDDTIGHVLGAALTRQLGDYSVTLSGVASAGSAIDNRQLGARFRREGRPTWIGGYYAGETSNPATLSQVGTAGGDAVSMRQAWVGISLPVGRFTVLGVFDYLRLGDASRRELAVVITVPLGGRDGR